ncbi:hypothetical protein [Cobetia marina]|uniref:hypothetical protein n=1 Tax=Cobetia marina TaxID=28258 RepID=UPI00385781FC
MKISSAIALSTTILVSSFSYASDNPTRKNLEDSIRSQFDTSSNPVPDLQIQLTKKASRNLMIKILSELNFMLKVPACKSTLNTLAKTDLLKVLTILGYQQEYITDSKKDFESNSELIYFSKKYEGWTEKQLEAECAYRFGELSGKISSLENVYYVPLQNLKNGDIDKKLQDTIIKITIDRIM